MTSEPSLSSSVVIQTPSIVSEQFPFPSVPYRGIEHYRFIDHRIFFVRQAETLELLRSVMIYKGVILFGSSGVGKSSLIDAGVLPRLLDLDFSPQRIRVQNRADGEIVIERISLNDDGKAPYLSPSLADGIATDERPRIVLNLEEFGKHLRAYAVDHYPLLVLDQFEEIITLFEEAPREPSSSLEEILKRQESIIDFLVGLLHDDSLRVKILFSFREDYLAKLTKLFMRAPELPNQYMRLNFPQKKALWDIIVRPLASELQAHYERTPDFSPKLIDALEGEFKQRADGDAINLSEVQIVCLELWESEDPNGLFQKRHIQGLLEDYLAGELDQFSDEHRGLAIGLLSHMLTVSNTRNFVSGVELIHMFQKEECVSEETLKHVLIALTGTRLVRRELRHKDYFYEIASEFLVPKIIEKKTERQTRLERCQLEGEREKERRLARQKLVQKNRLLALGVLVTVLSLALAWVMLRKRQQEESLKIQAQRAKEMAVQNASEKEQIISILRRLFKNQPDPRLSEEDLAQLKVSLVTDKIQGIESISSRIKAGDFPLDQVPALIGPSLTNSRDPQVAKAARDLLSEAAVASERQTALKQQVADDKLNAINEMRTLMRSHSFPPELVLSILGLILTDKDSNPAIASAAQPLFAEASAANRELNASITAAADRDPAIANLIPARVYVQMEGEQQSNLAKSIKAELEKGGYIVPQFETVGSFRAPAKNELRYYKRDEQTKAAEILSVLEKLHLEVELVYLEGHENSTRLRPGHFELWMARQSTSGEDRYLVVNAPAADERLALLNNLSSITEREGGTVQTLSRTELLIGPYSEEQVKNVRQRLIDQDPNLTRKGKLIVIKR
jgi:hypothetical protein